MCVILYLVDSDFSTMSENQNVSVIQSHIFQVLGRLWMIVQEAYSLIIMLGDEIVRVCSQKIKKLRYIFMDNLYRNGSYLG